MRSIDDDCDGSLRSAKRLLHRGQAVKHGHVGLRRVKAANLPLHEPVAQQGQFSLAIEDGERHRE